MNIRPAVSEEAEALSALALRSKAHWSYSPDELSVFKEELTLRPEEIDGCAYVLEDAGELRGFYTLGEPADGTVELEHLFVDPLFFGRGGGTQLFRHAVHQASERGYCRLLIQSDPNAEGFYRTLGIQPLRHIPSSIPGRCLPYFELELRTGSKSFGRERR